MRLLLLTIACILLLPTAFAATIQGEIYDISFENVDNVKVGIDTEPRQQIIAKNGSYEFTVNEGEYTLTAFEVENGSVVSSVQESITVSSEGTFTLDLILFPNLEEELATLSEIDSIVISDTLAEDPSSTSELLVILAILVAAVIMGLLLRKKRTASDTAPLTINNSNPNQPNEKSTTETALPKDLKEVVDIITQAGGRINQKELRKQLPLSEAKVSLMISELEHKGLIEKIKKGRGNIITLK